jgi:hypothetical protein
MEGKGQATLLEKLLSNDAYPKTTSNITFF